MEPITGAVSAIASVAKEATVAAEALEAFLQDASSLPKGEILIQQLDTIKNTTFESIKAQIDGTKASVGDLPKEVAHQQTATPVGHEIGRSAEIPNRDLENLGRTYNDEVSKCSAAGRVEPTDVRDWKKVSIEESRELRTEFNNNKPQLHREWESINGREWPRYEKDVIHPNTGKTLQKAGDCFETHHVQPLELGGKNTAENITPIHLLDHRDHMGIHRVDGPYHELAIQLRRA
jgi:hypothetical protein